MSNKRSKSYKQTVLKHFPKAVLAKDDLLTYKILSKERTGKRVLGSGTSAWSAWRDAATSTPVPKPVVIPKMKPSDKTPSDIEDENKKQQPEGYKTEQVEYTPTIQTPSENNRREEERRLLEDAKTNNDLPEIIEENNKFIFWIIGGIALFTFLVWWFNR